MDIREKIVGYLKEKYRPIAIISHGSRSSNYFTPQSDWDFWVITDLEVGSSVEDFEGQSLDVMIAKYPIEGEVAQIFGGTLQNARVLFDTNGKGEEILKNAREIYQQGRNLSDKERENRLDFITRRLKKLEDNTDNPGVFFFHLGTFYDRALRYWFEVKQNQWPKHPAIGLQVIKKNDHQYFDLLKVLFSENSSSKKLEAAREIVTGLK